MCPQLVAFGLPWPCDRVAMNSPRLGAKSVTTPWTQWTSICRVEGRGTELMDSCLPEAYRLVLPDDRAKREQSKSLELLPWCGLSALILLSTEHSRPEKYFESTIVEAKKKNPNIVISYAIHWFPQLPGKSPFRYKRWMRPDHSMAYSYIHIFIHSFTHLFIHIFIQ